MRLVFDTNVLLAAFLTTGGVCGDLVRHCALRHTPITSAFILNELRENLIHRFQISPTDAEDAVALLRERFVVVAPSVLKAPACRDPDDDAVQGTALAGQAQCIITGDKDLLTLGQYAGIDILKPNAFQEYEKRHS